MNWKHLHGANWLLSVAERGSDLSRSPLTSQLPVPLVLLSVALLTFSAVYAVTLEPVTFLPRFVGRGSAYLVGDIHGEPA